MTHEQRILKEILESMPSMLDESQSIKDWGLKYKKPKKPINFPEDIIENIIEYNP